MIFASIELAARIERAERSLVRDGVRAVARRDPRADVLVEPIAGGLAAYSGPSSPLNKLVGLGFGGPVDPAQLAAIERAFDARATPLQVELASLGEPGIATLLAQRGYELVGFENVLGLALPARLPPSMLGAPRPAVEIRACSAAELATWTDVVVTGFAHPDVQGVATHEEFPREVLDRVMGDMASAEGFTAYLVHRDGEPAAGGGMRMSEGVAQLCGSATLPAHRRRGIQSALLAWRLEQAGRASCDLAVITTQPGSKSQQNAQKQGFELLYVRAILVRPPRPAAATDAVR